jgi:hypothetical protein
VEETTRKCYRCGSVKLLQHFRPDEYRNGIKTNVCRECEKKRSRVWSKKYHSDVKRGKPLTKATGLLTGARYRSRKHNLECDLDLPWILERVSRGFCEVTGLPFVFDPDEPERPGARAFSPSLDRKDPSKGYTKDNTQVVVWVYNGAKGSNTHEDVLKMAEALCRK